MWYIYTMEYYSATKRNKTGSFVERWMDLRVSYRVAILISEKIYFKAKSISRDKMGGISQW